ncbi:MAG: MG2 domain-containing protein, partial [Desulfatitalea sp.]
MLCRSLRTILLAVMWLCLPAAVALGDAAPLKILRITPEGRDVPDGRQIVIEFNRPVVPLGRMERSADELPITVTPALKCQWRWINPSALACQLGDEEQMAPATAYQMTIAPGIRAEDGATLARSIQHSFTTIRPSVENAWFQTWRSPGTPVMLVSFNQPILQTSVRRHLYLQLSKGNRQRFALDVAPHPDDQEPPIMAGAEEARRMWQISPPSELPLESSVSLRVEPGLISARGPAPGAEQREVVRFDTFPAFKFRGLSCTTNAGDLVTIPPGQALASQPLCDPTGSIQLLFSTPALKDGIKTNLRVTPGFSSAPGGEDPWGSEESYSSLGAPHEKGQTYEVYLPPQWRARQTYRLRAEAAAVQDEFGRALGQPIELQFATDRLRPDYYLMHNPSVLEAGIDTQVPLFVTNLDEVTLDYSRLTADGLESRLRHKLSLPGERDVTLPIPLGVRDMLNGHSGAVVGTIDTQPELSDDPWKRSFFAQVSPYQVHVKLGHFNTLVWVTDLATGAPVPSARVTIYKDAPNTLSDEKNTDAVTDPQGVAQLPGTLQLDPRLAAVGWCREEDKCQRLFVRVSKDEHLALLPLDDNFLVDTYRSSRSSVSSSMQRDYGHMLAWGTTAQGVYRAGETIQYKFYMRNQDNTRLTAPPLEGYTLEVTDPTGKTVHTVKDITLSAFGAYDGEFSVPKSGAVGWYRFNVSAKFSEDRWQPIRVLVSDFTPSPFRARIELNGTLFRPDDTLQITSSAALHSGGPYPDAPLRVMARVAESTFTSDHPVAKAFTFYDETQRGDRTLPLYEIEERLDDQGKQTATLTVPAGEILYGRLVVESAVQDDRGKYVAAAASATYVGRDRFVGLQQTRWVYAAGEPAQIGFIVTDEKGQPTAGAAVQVTVERQETMASRVKGAGNAYLTEYTQTWAAVTDLRFTATEAPGLCTFTPAAPGYYRVTAAIDDTKGRPVRAQTYAWVAGKGEVLWEEPDDNSLQIIPEKEKLQVGDTGRYLIKNPYPGAMALISVERYGVIRHWQQRLEGSTPIIEVPVGVDDLPGFYLSVLVTSPRVDRPAEDGQVDLGKPAFRMGYLPVTVDDPYKQIDVEVRPERQTYKPGEKVNVRLRAVPAKTSAAGEPIELAVAVLDEAVLDLNSQGRDYYDPYKGFYHLGDLDLQNYSLLTRLVGRQKFEKKGATSGGDGGSDIGMRSLFKYVSYWNPSLAVDADGRANITFEAPDNLTGWRILVLAVTPADRLGLGDATVQVNRATEIRPVMPNQVLEGDRFQAGFSVMNRTGKPRSITV